MISIRTPKTTLLAIVTLVLLLAPPLAMAVDKNVGSYQCNGNNTSGSNCSVSKNGTISISQADTASTVYFKATWAYTDNVGRTDDGADFYFRHYTGPGWTGTVTTDKVEFYGDAGVNGGATQTIPKTINCAESNHSYKMTAEYFDDYKDPWTVMLDSESDGADITTC
jgi:hypothetical protein